MSLGEKFASELLVEAAKKALEKGEADPFDIALEAGHSVLRHLLDLSVVEKAPFLVEKEEEFAEEIVNTIAEIIACGKDYVEKAKKFYTGLMLGRLLFSPTARCIYTYRYRGQELVVECVGEKRALYEYILGDSNPLFLDPMDRDSGAVDKGQ